MIMEKEGKKSINTRFGFPVKGHSERGQKSPQRPRGVENGGVSPLLYSHMVQDTYNPALQI